MKTTRNFRMAFANMMTKTFSNSNKMVLAQNLPMNIKLFIMKNFPQLSITFASENNGYEVELNDETMVYFDKNGSWKKIENRNVALKTDFIPTSIQEFVTKTFFGQRIVMVEKKEEGFDVKLSNYIVLSFNTDGMLKG